MPRMALLAAPARIIQIGDNVTDVTIPSTAVSGATSIGINGLAANFVQPANAVRINWTGIAQCASSGLGAAANWRIIAALCDTLNANATLKTASARFRFTDTVANLIEANFYVSYISKAAPGTLVSINARAWAPVGNPTTGLTFAIMGSLTANCAMLTEEAA